MTGTVRSNRFDERARDELRREIVTPEGVPLVFTVARAGDRAWAFLIDAMLIALILLAILLSAWMLSFGGGGWISALLMLAVFLLRNGYFIWFELRWQGRTPGKRRAGLCVIDAHGQPLGADAIFVRNLTREAELFLPLVVLSAPGVLVSHGPGWVRAVSVLWLLVFLTFPMLNRERRRIGDLLAGTLVVRDPRTALERELTGKQARAETELQFTNAQLALYGVYELQVLEDLLRDEPNSSRALDVVAKSVRKKIAWPKRGPKIRSRAFLEAFYRDQRSRLEHDLLLGKARERKRKGRLNE